MGTQGRARCCGAAWQAAADWQSAIWHFGARLRRRWRRFHFYVAHPRPSAPPLAPPKALPDLSALDLSNTSMLDLRATAGARMLGGRAAYRTRGARRAGSDAKRIDQHHRFRFRRHLPGRARSPSFPIPLALRADSQAVPAAIGPVQAFSAHEWPELLFGTAQLNGLASKSLVRPRERSVLGRRCRPDAPRQVTLSSSGPRPRALKRALRRTWDSP